MSERCRSCHAEVIWGLGPGGKWMPFDAEPSARGEWRFAGDVPRAEHVPEARRADVLDPLYVTHWATCPHSAAWRERYR